MLTCDLETRTCRARWLVRFISLRRRSRATRFAFGRQGGRCLCEVAIDVNLGAAGQGRCYLHEACE